jgi:chromosome segregation ATPase
MNRSRRNWAADRALALAAACLLAAAAPAPSAEEAPERPAYVALVLADQARDRSQWRAALDRYREALTHFERLAAEQPDYKRESIRYRIDYCRSQIDAVQTRLATAAGGAPPAADVERARRENVELRRQVAVLQDQLEAAEKLARERAGLERTVAALRAEVAGLQIVASRSAESGAAAGPALAGDVAAENVRLRADLERAQAGYLRLAEAMARAESELAEIRAQEAGGRAETGAPADDTSRVEWARRVARLEAELRETADLRRRLDEETRARSDWTREKVRMARRIEELQREAAAAARWQDEAQAAQRRIDEMARSAPSVSTLVGELDAARRERDAARSERDEMARARAAAEEAGLDAQRRIGLLERKAESVRAQAERLAAKLSQAVEERDALEERLREAARPASDAAADPAPPPDDPALPGAGDGPR